MPKFFLKCKEIFPYVDLNKGTDVLFEKLNVTHAKQELLKMRHLRRRLRVFLFHGEIFRSRYSSFCIFKYSIIY